MLNYTEPDLLESVLRRYCHVEVLGAKNWKEDLLSFLRASKFPQREKEFRHQLASAILNKTISTNQYEKLTDLELETHEELVEELMDLWMHLYGDEPIKLENL